MTRSAMACHGWLHLCSRTPTASRDVPFCCPRGSSRPALPQPTRDSCLTGNALSMPLSSQESAGWPRTRSSPPLTRERDHTATGVVRADLPPDLLGERGEGKDVLAGVLEVLRHAGQLLCEGVGNA